MWILIGCFAASFAPSVASAEYQLTTIARSDEPTFGGFAGTIDWFVGATLNGSGQVAFLVIMKQLAVPPPCVTWNNVVAVGDGNSVTTLNDPSSGFYPFGIVGGINEAGQTSFLGQHLTEVAPGECEIGIAGVYRGEMGGITKIADESIFDGIDHGSSSQVDESGTVAFMSRGAVRNGVYQGDGTESVFGDYVVIEENPSGTGPPIYRDMVAVNASGQVAYLVDESAGFGVRISRSGPSGPVTIAQVGDTIEGAPGSILGLHPPAMSDSGSVAFIAILYPPAFGVFIEDGNSIQIAYLETSPEANPQRVVSINNEGAVLIGGSFDGQEGLYIVQDGDYEQVVKVGDPLLGSTIDSVYALQPALNDAGQVAFHAEVAGGTQVIVRADPIVAEEVPGISWLPMGGLAALLAAFGVSRLARID
jgi:hypothetical protein